jgi:hypothetical protein
MPGEKISPISNSICDLLMDIQMRCKFVEELITSYNSGLRDQEDFNARFVNQGTILGDKCRLIAPHVNALLMKGEFLYQNKENPNIIRAYKNIELLKQKELNSLKNEYNFREVKNESPVSLNTPWQFLTLKGEGMATEQRIPS